AVALPDRSDEVAVLTRHDQGFDPRDLAGAGISPVAGSDDLLGAREQVEAVEVADEVLGYIVDVCRATRSAPSLSLGVSPRGATMLLATSKAWAWLSGRDFVTPDDVKALARPTLPPRAVAIGRSGATSTRLGEPVEVMLLVVNQGGRRARGWVRDGWPPSAGSGPRSQRLDLAPGRRTRVTTTLRPTRRGERRAGPVT